MNQRQHPSTSQGLMLVLTIPQLNLSAKDITSILRLFYDEVLFILEAFVVSFLVYFKALLIAIPQLVLVHRMLQRLPAVISLALNDNITFEDALGRVQSLQFQQFRHWPVFEASLRCHFDQLPGLRQILCGNYVLTLPNQGIEISARNWAAIIRPGVLIEMAIVLTHWKVQDQKCPRKCLSDVSRLRDKEYCCNQCGLVFECYKRSVVKAPPDAIAAAHRPWIQEHSLRASASPPRVRRGEFTGLQNRGLLPSVVAPQAERHIVDSYETHYQPPLQSRTYKARDWVTPGELLEQAINAFRNEIEADMRDLTSLKRVCLHDVASRFVETPIPNGDVDPEVIEVEIADFHGTDASVEASSARSYTVASCRVLTTDMLRWIRQGSHQYRKINFQVEERKMPPTSSRISHVEDIQGRDLGEKTSLQLGSIIQSSDDMEEETHL